MSYLWREEEGERESERDKKRKQIVTAAYFYACEASNEDEKRKANWRDNEKPKESTGKQAGNIMQVKFMFTYAAE